MLDRAWALSGSVALRPEPFGALAYDFASRRLSFLKSPDLVAVVRRLDGSATLREVLVGEAVPEARWPAFVRALESLADSRMLTPSDPTPIEESACPPSPTARRCASSTTSSTASTRRSA